MAEHRLVSPAQVQKLLGISESAARARLGRLTSAGHAREVRPFGGRATFHMIARRGLREVGSPLSPPRLDLSCHEHDLGLAWLWLAARAGAFGPLEAAFSERSMRSHDALAPAGTPPHAIRLGGVGPGGRERLHYPDLLLLTRTGERIAVELELTSKGRTRRERILSGYAGDVRVDAVLYLVPNRMLARAIQASARRVAIERLVHVQMISLPSEGGAAASGWVLQRRGDRKPTRPVLGG